MTLETKNYGHFMKIRTLLNYFEWSKWKNSDNFLIWPQNEKTKATLFYETLKVGSNKVPLLAGSEQKAVETLKRIYTSLFLYNNGQILPQNHLWKTNVKNLNALLSQHFKFLKWVYSFCDEILEDIGRYYPVEFHF